MDPALKHRLIGAAVLSAIAIIFLPMLMVGHDVNDTASTVPLKVPTAPQGDFQTKELPLVAPSPTVPSGGVVGMDTSHPASPALPASPVVEAGGVASPAASTAASGAAANGAASAASTAASPATPAPVPVAASPRVAPAASPAVVPPAPIASPKAPPPAAVTPPPAASTATALPVAPPVVPPAASPSAPIPAANAGGHYVVSLGTYSSTANAQALVASLQAKQLPAYAETVAVAGKPGMRVRIGPFQQRGDAEAARLRAQQVRKDMPTSVTALDAAVAAPTATPVVAAPGKATAPAIKPVASPKATPGADASTQKETAVPASPKTAEPDIGASGAGKSTKSAEPVVASASGNAISSKTSTRSVEPVAAASGSAISSKTSVGYAVQVTAFRSEDEALKLRGKLRGAGFTAFTEKVQTDSGTLFRVRIGPAANRDEADHLRTELSAKLGLSSMVVAYP